MASNRFGVVASCLSEDPRHAARLARELGLGGLLFDSFSSSVSIPELSTTGTKEFRHVLAAQAQELIGLRADVGPKGMGPGADIDRLLWRLDAAMRVTPPLRHDVKMETMMPAAPRAPSTRPASDGAAHVVPVRLTT